MDNNPEVFAGKQFQELLKDIYVNSRSKKKRIHTLMESIIPMIDSAQAAAIVVPVVKELLDVEIKNDEHLVKLATICQRIITAELKESGGVGPGSLLSEEEKKRLLESARDDLALAFVEDKEIDELQGLVDQLQLPSIDKDSTE